jgi:hypothetical protein
VASFDIDRGPIMEHQFPVAITGDEHMLAELMLPDQAHARNQDWTIFFLHKDQNQEEEEQEQKKKDARRRRRKRRRDREAGITGDDEDTTDEEHEGHSDMDYENDDWDDDESTDEEPEGGEGPPLIYVLNLVYTKHDKTAKRGAVVKAMAICTRHPFLHIYKVRQKHYACKNFVAFALHFSNTDLVSAPPLAGIGGVLQVSSARNTIDAL